MKSSSNQILEKVMLKSRYIKKGTLRQATLWAGKCIVDLEVFKRRLCKMMKKAIKLICSCI